MALSGVDFSYGEAASTRHHVIGGYQTLLAVRLASFSFGLRIAVIYTFTL